MRVIVCLLAAVVVAAAAIAQPASSNAASVEIQGDSIASRVLTLAELARLPHQSVTATAHGRTHTFRGVALVDVLRHAGVQIDTIRGSRAAHYVLVEAADGYRVVFALAELSPRLGNRAVWLVHEQDGAPIPASDGPLRLVVPDDQRPTRWARQVIRLRIKSG